ncbi:MAG: MurR/RpiR family transcriptional regulator [Deltaproteobacteria bacterium]|nr:MurR/RpiR family transcriptional regulator [Deltaproteobacteria bacterium]
MTSSAKKEFFERIIKIYPNLSSKKKRIADFIIQDYKKLFLMKAKEIAVVCQVSEPTFSRFILDLGFAGYEEFEQYLKGLLHTELTSVERMLKSTKRTDNLTTLKAYYQNTLRNLEHMIHSISEQEVRNLARRICQSDFVLVAGYRASSILASYFGFLLKKIRPGVTLDTQLSWDTFDQIALHGPSLLLVVIAFPRYANQAIELIEFAKKNRVSIIGISDTPRSPIIPLADQYLIVDVEGLSFVDPFSHLITLLGALIHEIAFMDKTATLKRLSQIEEGIRKRPVFYSLDTDTPPDGNPLEAKYYTLLAAGGAESPAGEKGKPGTPVRPERPGPSLKEDFTKNGVQ